MGKIILVTGGSRSGKSTYAEKFLEKYDDVLYIATATVTDSEMEERVRKHKERRNKSWKTHEGFKNLDEIINSFSGSVVMLDCVTNMISNLMFNLEKNIDNITEEEKDVLFSKIHREFSKLIDAVNNSNKTLIMVTNEVGMGLISEYSLGRMFTDYQGFINQFLSSVSDEVIFMVSGIAMKIKGES